MNSTLNYYKYSFTTIKTDVYKLIFVSFQFTGYFSTKKVFIRFGHHLWYLYFGTLNYVFGALICYIIIILVTLLSEWLINIFIRHFLVYHCWTLVQHVQINWLIYYWRLHFIIINLLFDNIGLCWFTDNKILKWTKSIQVIGTGVSQTAWLCFRVHYNLLISLLELAIFFVLFAYWYSIFPVWEKFRRSLKRRFHFIF